MCGYTSGSRPNASAQSLSTGNDIYFAPGRYQPDTIQGQQLLGHELAHVVQQRQGRVRNPLGAALAVVQDRALEAEADRLGRLAATAPRTWPSQPNAIMRASKVAFPRLRPVAAPAKRFGAPNTLQRVVTLNEKPVDSHTDLAEHWVGIYPDKRKVFEQPFQRRLELLQQSHHHIDFTWTALPAPPLQGSYTVTVNGQPVAGQFNSLARAVGAAEVAVNDVDRAEAESFHSLKADQRAGRYTITRVPKSRIQYPEAESQFKKYSQAQSVKDAVKDAIDRMEEDGTSQAKYSRLDLQPSSGAAVYNFQVQLGGSEPFRPNKGDTSSTLVVISAEIFNDERAINRGRWRQVMQAAHRESFDTKSKLTFSKSDVFPALK